MFRKLLRIKVLSSREKGYNSPLYAHNVSDRSRLNCQRESHYGKIRFGLSPELRRWPPGQRALFYATEKFMVDAYRTIVSAIFFFLFFFLFFSSSCLEQREFKVSSKELDDSSRLSCHTILS